jgi:hypothetical protein
MGTIRSRALTVGLLGVLSAGGCLLPPPPGELVPPRVEVLTADSRSTRYGGSAAQVFEHPAIRDKVRALFGPDWTAGRAGGLSAAAPVFFSTSSPPKVFRVGDREYLAVSGCVATACTTRRGLVLIGADAERLLARVDDGGFTLHYGFGPGMRAMTPQDRLLVDAAWRALR